MGTVIAFSLGHPDNNIRTKKIEMQLPYESLGTHFSSNFNGTQQKA